MQVKRKGAKLEKLYNENTLKPTFTISLEGYAKQYLISMLCAQFHKKLHVFTSRKYKSTLDLQPRRPLPLGVYDLVF
jgi:hypothetical protein